MHLDHVVVSVSDLEKAMEKIKKDLGCTPIYGGKHPSLGTHNAILGIVNNKGYKQYVEFIAIDPSEKPREFYPFGMSLDMSTSKIVGWAVACEKTEDIQVIAKKLQSLGKYYNYGEVFSMKRKIPSGKIISWRIAYTPDLTIQTNGVIPFLISWDDNHPVDQLADSNKVDSCELYLVHPLAKKFNEDLQAVGLRDVIFQEGDASQIELKLYKSDQQFIINSGYL